MKKSTFIFAILFSVALGAQAQSVLEKLDKQAKDPKTAENAAKADVYVSKNKNIFDSTTKVQGSDKKVAKKAGKKKNCHKKSS